MQDTPEEKPFEIKVSGNGVDITQDVSQEMARSIIDILMGGAPRYTNGGSGAPRGQSGTGGGAGEKERALSLREFLDEALARRNPDKMTAIGEFLAEHEHQAEFSRDDIKSRFKTAGEPAPANFSRDFNWTLSNGWIAEDPKNQGSYYVTKKGRDAIDAKFAAEIKKGTRQKFGGRRRPAKRKSNDSEGRDE